MQAWATENMASALSLIAILQNCNTRNDPQQLLLFHFIFFQFNKPFLIIFYYRASYLTIYPYPGKYRMWSIPVGHKKNNQPTHVPEGKMSLALRTFPKFKGGTQKAVTYLNLIKGLFLYLIQVNFGSLIGS